MDAPTTIEATEWWLQHAAHQGEPWVERYWQDWQAPHRSHILFALALLAPVRSVFEIGCASGPNLRLIRHHMPHIMLSGQEMVRGAAEKAEGELGVPVMVSHLPQGLSVVANGHADVILSCYTLAYLDECDVQEAITESCRIANKAVILVEPMGERSELSRHDLPEWRHNYRRFEWPAGWSLDWRWPIMPNVQALNGCAIFVKE